LAILCLTGNQAYATATQEMAGRHGSNAVPFYFNEGVGETSWAIFDGGKRLKGPYRLSEASGGEARRWLLKLGAGTVTPVTPVTPPLAEENPLPPKTLKPKPVDPPQTQKKGIQQLSLFDSL
jgi:hypothetical protein